MLLGDSSVGKTCLLVRFKDGAFLGGNFIATVGIDFRVRDAAQQPQRANPSLSCFLWLLMLTVLACMWSTLSSERIIPPRQWRPHPQTSLSARPSQ